MTRRLLRLFFEYVGNVDGDAERRRDGKSRMFLDHIKDEMRRRGVPAEERERLLEELRDSVRATEPERAG